MKVLPWLVAIAMEHPVVRDMMRRDEEQKDRIRARLRAKGWDV